MHLDSQAECAGLPPGFAHRGRFHVAVANRPGGCGRGTGRMVLVNPQRHDPIRMLLYERRHARGSIWGDRIEQAGSLEETRRRLMLEAILQVAMVVLVR